MKKIVALTGAGISAESGFQTFRDAGGLWEKYPVEQVATPEGWDADPNLVTDFYNGLRKQLLTAQPNDAHKILAALEKDFDVTVVTQNVDNLHERAGSSHVIHLHGEQVIVPHGAKAPDGSLLRPYIVWFGEAVPLMSSASSEAEKADIFLVIGTSLNVYPAAGLINYVPRTAPIYVIDPKVVKIADSPRIHFLQTTATAGMRQLREELERMK